MTGKDMMFWVILFNIACGIHACATNRKYWATLFTVSSLLGLLCFIGRSQ